MITSKVFLMAAGRGERLGELTKDTPKCLLPVGCEPLLQRWLDKFLVWKFDEVIITVSHQADKIIEFIERNKDRWVGIKITIVREYEPWGTARTLFVNRHRINDDCSFGVVYADVWTTFDMREIINRHRINESLVTLGVHLVKDYAQKGAVVVRNGVVVEYEEKPKKARSPLVWSGIMIANPSIFDLMDESMTDISYDLIPKLIKTGTVRIYSIFDPVIDIGESVEKYNSIEKGVI